MRSLWLLAALGLVAVVAAQPADVAAPIAAVEEVDDDLEGLEHDDNFRNLFADILSIEEDDDDDDVANRQSRAMGGEEEEEAEEKAIQDPKDLHRYNAFIDTFFRRLNSYARSNLDPVTFPLTKRHAKAGKKEDDKKKGARRLTESDKKAKSKKNDNKKKSKSNNNKNKKNKSDNNNNNKNKKNERRPKSLGEEEEEEVEEVEEQHEEEAARAKREVAEAIEEEDEDEEESSRVARSAGDEEEEEEVEGRREGGARKNNKKNKKNKNKKAKKDNRSKRESRAKKDDKKKSKKNNNNKKSDDENKAARASVSGLATVRREGDVKVQNAKNGKVIKADFTMGPVGLKLTRQYGKGKDAIARTAKASSDKLTGQIAIKLTAEGAATVSGFKVKRPDIVRVEGSLARKEKPDARDNLVKTSMNRFTPYAALRLKRAAREVLKAAEPKKTRAQPSAAAAAEKANKKAKKKDQKA